MKRVKPVLFAICFVAMVMVLSSVAFAFDVTVGASLYAKCPFCDNLSYGTVLSYQQATANSSGSIKFSFGCGHSISRTTKYWGAVEGIDASFIGIGDLVDGLCPSSGSVELQFVSRVIALNTCTARGRLYCYHLASCGSVGILGVPALDHDYIATRTDPTCTAPGSIVSTCSRCNDTETETLPALGHDYSVTARNDPTCAAPGSVTFTCSRCNDVKTEELPPSYHSWDTAEMVPSVYDEDGDIVTEGYTFYTCSSCGSSYTAVAGTSPPAAGPVSDSIGGSGMSDTTAALGKTFLSGIWSLFGISVPGFGFTFGQMWLGVLLCSVSILVIRMIFGFGGGPRGDAPRTSSTSNPRISKERRRDEY